jgi:hypothetical protein
MIYTLCEKLWQDNFIIAIVVKLLINSEEFNKNVKFSKTNIFGKFF